MDFVIPIIKILGGFAVLVWGAERFVHGAAATAKNLGVSIMAAINGNPGIAVGNALGSNITNIGLVLGCTALIFPLVVSSRLLKREFPILLATTALGLFLLWDNELSRLDGMILIGTMVVLTLWLIRQGMSQPASEPLTAEIEQEIPAMTLPRAIMWTVLGLVLLLISSRFLVDGAVALATLFGVSDMVIGLTIIAIGTSLPELAASLVSAFKKEPDMAIGNVIGSNMFNLLAVLGIPGLISPIALENQALSRDYSTMMIMTVVLFLFAYGIRGPGRINRLEGGLLLTGYLVYMLILYFSIHH